MIHISKYLPFGAIAMLALAAAGCDKDGDTLYTAGPDEAVISTSASDIVLDKDHLQALALTLYWNANGDISLSDPRVAAPSPAASNTVELAADPEFLNMVEDNVEAGVYSRQYTCEQLNNFVGRLGFEGGVKTPLYVRVKTVLGPNIEPKYSKTLELTVTSYYIDMTVGFVLDASHTDTGRTLSSPDADGVYRGFIGAGAWENWWLREGNNTEWGNDGVDGTPFMMGNSLSGLDVWNFWYPGLSGCYYTVVDTQANEWSALLLPSLTIAGDIKGEMTFDRKSNCWTYTYQATPGTLNLTLSATGMQYNIATGTDDSAAIPTPVGFSGSADALTFGSAAQPVALQVTSSGETTITLNLSNPNAWTLTAAAGGGEPVETVPPVIYLSGVLPDWDFNSYLKLYDEDHRNYGGALNVNSEWGYRIYTEPNAWDNYWSMVAGGSAFEGSLVNCGDTNILAPEPGFYLFDVSMGGLYYKVTPITKVSYAGINDDWTLREMTATGTPGEYTVKFDKSANTPWGVKIVLNDNWDLYFGGNGTDGELSLFHEGFSGDNDLSNGPHTLTVNLSTGTYKYE